MNEGTGGVGAGATVLVAGASGALGREVARELAGRGYRVRALARDPERARIVLGDRFEIVRGDVLRGTGLEAAAASCDAVVSSVGASLDPSPLRGWRSFLGYDFPANARLIDAAGAAGVKRFVYVSTFHTEATRPTHYVRAHEAVVDRLRASGLAHAVLRPTGFFSAFDMLLRAAMKGVLVDLGDGRARTNPIHPEDLAVLCADAVAGGPSERSVGGPEVLTRGDIANLIARATGARVVRVPLALARVGRWALAPVFPRTAHLLEFFSAVSSSDSIAPVCGSRQLAAYVESRVRELAAAGASRQPQRQHR